MEIIETSVFQKQVDETLSFDDYMAFQDYLIKNPEKGDIIQGTGGARKIRYALPGKGKSGGIRTIYYYKIIGEAIYLLYLYKKNEQADLNEKQKKALYNVIKEL